MSGYLIEAEVKHAIIGTGNDWSSDQHQTIIWTSIAIL